MIINRTRANLFSVNWTNKGAQNYTGEEFKFHPGENFVPDKIYFDHLASHPEFQSQIKAQHLIIEVPPRKAGKGEKAAVPATAMHEEIKALDKDKAIEIVGQILDGVELKEIMRFDGRPAVVTAAEKQIENRQTYMNGMQPPVAPIDPGQKIKLPGANLLSGE